MPEIQSEIDAVTVYTDRAQVTRKGRVQLGPGAHAVELPGLPRDLLAETVRAGARSTGSARLLSTDVQRTFHNEPPEVRPAELQAQIQDLQDRDEALARREAALGTRRTFLQTLGTAAGTEIARGIAFGRVTVDAGVAVSSFLGEQLDALEAESLEIARQRRELGKELNVLRAKLQSPPGGRTIERHKVVVQVQMASEGELELELSYQVPGAGWTPLYDLRLRESRGTPTLELEYQAQVTQRTGEDWQNAALTLSTAKPALSAILPELDPWFLYVPRPAAPPMMRARTVAQAPAMAMGGSATQVAEEGMMEEYGSPAFEPAAVETAAVNEGGPAVSFSLSGRTDIPSDGTPHKVTLAFHEFPARLDYVSAPKLVTQAFRRARARNESNLLLLPGAAQVFHDEEFVGTTRLETLAPGQEVELFLGVDDRVKVERKLVQGSVDKKFLADVRRLTYTYEIKVTNLRERPETVTVLDQIPVSRHEHVKVRRGEVRPEPIEQSELGEMRWELLLDPRQERTLRFAFTVETPRDLPLQGLPSVEGA